MQMEYDKRQWFTSIYDDWNSEDVNARLGNGEASFVDTKANLKICLDCLKYSFAGYWRFSLDFAFF